MYQRQLMRWGGFFIFIVKKRLCIPGKEIKQASPGISWERAEVLLSPHYFSFQSRGDAMQAGRYLF